MTHSYLQIPQSSSLKILLSFLKKQKVLGSNGDHGLGEPLSEIEPTADFQWE